MNKFAIISFFICTILLRNSLSFPDGAPVDACVKPRPNQPYHGQSRPQPSETNPYQVIASSDTYYSGTQITGSFRFIKEEFSFRNATV